MQSAEPSRENIKADRQPRGLLQLTLCRPERSNALSPAMIQEIDREIAAAEGDASVRLIVLRGEGKHFCGGADIGAPRTETSDDENAPRGPSLADTLLRWDRLAKPTVAFVQGACLGAGLALVSCCDVVVAAPSAFFAMPEVRRGMVPGILPFFLRAIGPRAFRRFGLSGERFDASAALRCGLVSEIYAQSEWGNAQARLLDSFLHAAPGTLAAIKAEAARHAGVAIDPDRMLGRRRVESAEEAEGKASFREKREPNWYVRE